MTYGREQKGQCHTATWQTATRAVAHSYTADSNKDSDIWQRATRTVTHSYMADSNKDSDIWQRATKTVTHSYTTDSNKDSAIQLHDRQQQEQ